MSENETQPPVPSKQTSNVPLKKETVRVTLKAADAPAVPSATVPMAPPMAPPVKPPVPGGAPPTPTTPAPTIPLRPTAAPAPTIRLATATSALRPAGTAPTLPKATVQLQAPTQPIGTSFPSSKVSFAVEPEEEEEPQSGLVKILSGAGFAAALVVLILQLLIANTWISQTDPRGENYGPAGDWMRLFQ